MAHAERGSISLLVLGAWIGAMFLVSVLLPVTGSVPFARRHIVEGTGAGFTKPTPSAVPPEAAYPRTLASKGSIPVGSGPVALSYDGANENLYVANAGSNNLTVASASNGSNIASIALSGLGERPTAEVYDGGSAYVYVAGLWLGACTGCSGPWTAAINGSTNRIVATNTSMQGIDVRDAFDCLGYNPVSAEVYACDTVGKLIIMNGTTDTIIGSVRVGSLPSGVAVDESNGDSYVTNWGSDNVSVIGGATNAVVDSIPVGSGPDAVAYDRSNGYLYVANNESDNVTVIDGASNAVVGAIPVGCNPDAVAVDSERGNVFVANACSSNVTVISSATDAVVGAVTVGSYPDAIALDPADGQVYVANAGSNNVTVIPAEPAMYRVAFIETGLPSAGESVSSSWSVTLNGLAEGSTASTIVFIEPNGTYSFTVGSVPGHTATPSAGNVVVHGAAANQTLTFSFSGGESSSSGFLGLPGSTGYYLLGVVAVALVGVAVGLFVWAHHR